MNYIFKNLFLAVISLVKFVAKIAIIFFIFYLLFMFLLVRLPVFFMFMDNSKLLYSSKYNEFRKIQIQRIIPEECKNVGLEKENCKIYIDYLMSVSLTGDEYKKYKGDSVVEKIIRERNGNKKTYYLSYLGELSKNYYNDTVKNTIIAQARIDINVCNAFSNIFSQISPNEFACSGVPVTMEKLGGTLYDLKFLMWLYDSESLLSWMIDDYGAKLPILYDALDEEFDKIR